MQAEITQQINANSVISVTLLIVIIGAVWRQAVYQTKVTLQLEAIQRELKVLKPLERRVMHLEQGVETIEEDVNNLWAKIEGRPLDMSRRNRFRPLPAEKDE